VEDARTHGSRETSWYIFARLWEQNIRQEMIGWSQNNEKYWPIHSNTSTKWTSVCPLDGSSIVSVNGHVPVGN